MKKLISFLLIFLLFASFAQKSYSEDEVDKLTKEINNLNTALNMSINATRPLETELKRLQAQITGIKTRVAFIENDIILKKKNIDQSYVNLEKQTMILGKTVRNYYINSYYYSPLLVFLSGDSASEMTQILAYQKKATDQDKLIITNISLSIADLETKKKNLEEEQNRLAVAKASLDEQSGKLDKIVGGAKAYQASLTSQIAQLSAKQQEIIAQKLGSLNISRSAYSMGRCDSDLTNGRDPGFSPKFAIFTYGVPNRVGLNQYGAKGRASFQGHEDILKAYFNDISFETRSNMNIKVQGRGEMPLETYLLGICEMPENWPMEALKAQVVAARSYALAYTNNGANEICTTESCQVYCGEKTGQWKTAVQETPGKVMVQGGNPIKAWYSSTHGGYVFSSGEIGWSGTSWTKHANDFSGLVNSFSDLNNNAYDKESPWFYCDWGSRAEYNKTAWLKPDEMADIVNVILLARKDSSLKPHLYQTDKPNPEGQETWSSERVRQELGSSAFSSISEMSVSADFGSGKSTNVTVSGNGKSESFGGSEFKDWFNLRAPSNINIVGPLYNVEKR